MILSKHNRGHSIKLYLFFLDCLYDVTERSNIYSPITFTQPLRESDTIISVGRSGTIVFVYLFPTSTNKLMKSDQNQMTSKQIFVNINYPDETLPISNLIPFASNYVLGKN